MKPHKHVLVVRAELDRKSFTRQGMHMNNSGKDKIALKIANVVTKIFLKQEEIISLHWKNEYEDSVIVLMKIISYKKTLRQPHQ